MRHSADSVTTLTACLHQDRTLWVLRTGTSARLCFAMPSVYRGYLLVKPPVAQDHLGVVKVHAFSAGMILSITRFCPFGVSATSPGVLVLLISLDFRSLEKATVRLVLVLFFACCVNSSLESLCPSA